MNVIKSSHVIMDVVDGEEILKKLELCGRTAYKSEDKITPDSSLKFVEGLMKRGHESVIEHVNISVRFICDRGVTHELVRHRLCAYTQESTRYCNYGKLGITFIKPMFWKEGTFNYVCWLGQMEFAERAYNDLINNGAKPEQARSVLPNSLKTEIVCTANLREWRHIMKLRTAKSAHPQMRELMIPLLQDFKRLIPVIFDEISVD